MLLNEINSNLVQKYGKERVNAILNRNISYLTHHINKICEFVYDEGIDIDKVQKAFRQYEQLKNQGEAFDYRNLNFEDFLSMLNNYSIDSVSLPNVVYTSKDKMIQIGKFQTFEEAIDFQNKTNITCCFCDKEKAWIMYNNNYSLFVIRNLYQSQKSRLRYVIVTVKDGIPYFFDMDDKSLKKERGEQVYQKYIQSLGGAESILFENKTIYNKNTNMNKKLIRLTESDLHRIVKESVDKILMETQSEDASESIDENNTNEGFMGDMWNGIKRGAYQMTHRPEAMSDYDKRNSNSQRMRNNYANQQRQGVINRGIAKEKGLDMTSRNRRKMINQREGFSN